MEVWEIGLFQSPIAVSNPFLCIAFWICLLLGVGIELLLCWRCRQRSMRWLLIVIGFVGLTGSELACQIITGWDRLVWLLLYFYCLTLLVGAGMGMLFCWLYNKWKNT